MHAARGVRHEPQHRVEQLVILRVIVEVAHRPECALRVPLRRGTIILPASRRRNEKREQEPKRQEKKKRIRLTR